MSDMSIYKYGTDPIALSVMGCVHREVERLRTAPHGDLLVDAETEQTHAIGSVERDKRGPWVTIRGLIPAGAKVGPILRRVRCGTEVLVQESGMNW